MKKIKRISVDDFRKQWGDSLRGALVSPVVITVRGTGTHVVMSLEKYKELSNEKVEARELNA